MTIEIIREHNGGAVLMKYRYRCLRCSAEAITLQPRHPKGWAALEIRTVCRTTGRLHVGKFGDLCPLHTDLAVARVPDDEWRRVGSGEAVGAPD